MYRCSNVVIQNTLFENNTAASRYRFDPTLTIGVGTLIGFQTGGALTISYMNSTAGDSIHTALVKNCIFRNNRAGINASNSEDAAQRPILYIPRGHGGALHIAFQNTEGHSVTVEGGSFEGNSAQLSGGAVSILFYRGVANTEDVQFSSSNNTVRLDGVTFRDNHCGEEEEMRGNGGAVSINTFEAANTSKVIVSNSRFEGNSATNEGGALSFIIEVSQNFPENFLIDLILCNSASIMSPASHRTTLSSTTTLVISAMPPPFKTAPLLPIGHHREAVPLAWCQMPEWSRQWKQQR